MTSEVRLLDVCRECLSDLRFSRLAHVRSGEWRSRKIRMSSRLELMAKQGRASSSMSDSGRYAWLQTSKSRRSSYSRTSPAMVENPCVTRKSIKNQAVSPSSVNGYFSIGLMSS